MAVVHDIIDVVIVGAGLSGLQAALDVQKAGLSFIILEARSRVGGKTLSVPLKSGRGVVDIGAAWLNEHTQPRIHALAKHYGFETVIQPTEGDEIFQDVSGNSNRVGKDQVPPLSQATLETVGLINNLLESEASKIDLRSVGLSVHDNITVHDFLVANGASDDAYQVVQTSIRGLLGVDATELSLYYYLNYIKSGGSLEDLGSDDSNGGQYQRLRQGMQSISKAMAADLKAGSLFLDSPVSKIYEDGELSIVTTQQGANFKAKKVILSIPTPLYRTIQFSPPLPTKKQTLAESTTLGYYAKTILIYDTPWWREFGLKGSFTSLSGAFSFTRDSTVEQDRQYSITCFHVGGAGRAWSILSPRKRQATVLAQLASMVGIDAAAQVYKTEEIIEQEWIKEPYSMGAPSPVMGPGLLSQYNDSLRAPFRNIHFVGTETAHEWKGYMNGAITAGERGAQEVITALGN